MKLAELRESVAREERRVYVGVEADEVRSEVDETSGAPKIVGHAAVFDRLSQDMGGFREIIKRGAFRKVLDDAQDVKLQINHEGLPLARTKSRTLELREDPTGLRVYAELDPTNPRVQELTSAMRRGDIDQMSFGFRVAKGGDKWMERNGEVIREIRQFERVLDVSAVAFPAYAHTDVGLRMERVQKGSIDLTKLSDEARGEIVAEIRSLSLGVPVPSLEELAGDDADLADKETEERAEDAKPTGDTSVTASDWGRFERRRAARFIPNQE